MSTRSEFGAAVSRRAFLRGATALSLSASATALLEGCGGASATAAKGQVSQLTFFKGPWVPNEPNFVEEDAAAFYTANPHIRITETQYQWATRDQDLARAFSSSSVPDVIYFSEMYWARYAALGALAPLDSFIDGDTAFQSTRAQIPDAFWTQSRWKGQTYGVPWVTALGSSNIANLDLLEAAGVSDWSSSITAMRTAARKVREKTKAWGFAGPTVYSDGSWLQIAAYIQSAGTSIYNGNFTKAALNTPGFVENLQTLQDIYITDRTAPAAGLYESPALNGLWLAGKIGIYNVAGNDSVGPAQLQGIKFKVGLAPQPGPVPGQYGSYLGMGHLAISAASKNKQAAWEYVKYLSSRGGILPWEKALQLEYLAARRDMTANLYDLSNPVQRLEADSYRRLVTSGLAKPFPPEPHLAPVQVVISNEFQSCLSGQQSPEATATNMESQINNILESPV